VQQRLQEQEAEVTASQDAMQPEKGSLSGLLATSEPCQEKINTREHSGQCLAEFEDKAASAKAQLAKLADEKQAIILETEEITKQLEDSLSSDKATRISLVREWISEIQQYRPENDKVITDRITAVHSGAKLRKNCAESEAIAQNLMAEQPGLVLLETREWLLPVAVMAAEYTLEGERDLTLFEKFIIKCIASGLQELSSPEAIAGLLNLEVALVDQHVNNLVRCCLLIESQNDGGRYYKLSALGQEVYLTGKVLTTLHSGNVIVTVNAQYEWLAIWKQGVSSFGDTDSDLPVFRYSNKQEELALRNYYPTDKQEVRHSVEEKIREWYMVQQQEPVIQVYEPRYQHDVKLRLAEFWLYDLVRDQIFCRVWSFAQQAFCSKLEFALTSLEGRQRLDEMQVACNNNKQWTDFIAELRSQAKHGFSTLIEESLSGVARHSVLLQAIGDTHKLLFLMMPDCAEIAADAEITKCLRHAVNRGCHIFIGWGNDREAEQRSAADEVFKRLHNIQDGEGFPGVFTLYVGNQERETVLVDEQWLLTWLPGLTYQGKQLMQKQVVAQVVDKSWILEQQLVLEGVFLKQLERQLLQNQLTDPIKCVTWFYALLTLCNHNYIREILAEEALAKVMDIHSTQTLFKLLAVYVKVKQYESGFNLLLIRLAAREDSQAKLTYWLDKLRTRNPNAYKKIIPIYKTIRKRK
jgi:predicted transcriptional regulator